MVKGFEITTAEIVTDLLFKHRDNYNEKGKYLGWEKLHELYSMSLGNCTDWSGLPMSGKTQVLMELLVNTSKWYGWKHLVYFPDVGTNVEIIADLIHKKTGKTFKPDQPNTIEDSEITKGAMWVTNYFKVLTKRDVKAKLTPIEFWDMAVELKKSEGLHTASIDSWKDMNHKYNEHGGYAQYLEFVLPYRNQIAEDNDLHLHTIIHPKETDKDKNGKRTAPRPYDLKGGSEWFNSGKCMITVHREDVTNNVVKIMVNKVKPRALGKVGELELFFDMNTFTYYDTKVEGLKFTKIYASPLDEPPATKTTEIKPLNTNMSSFGGYEQKTIEDFDNECPF